jgi:hypothetical protein
MLPVSSALGRGIRVAAPLPAAILEWGKILPGKMVELAEAGEVEIAWSLPWRSASLGHLRGEIAPFGAVEDLVVLSKTTET